jgi:RimJ/RimL family protein N-acetyltransferase
MGTDEILVWCTQCRKTTPVPTAKLDHDRFCHCGHCQSFIWLNQPELVQRRMRVNKRDIEPEDIQALRQYMTEAEIKEYYRRKLEAEREREEFIERKMYGSAL